MNANEILNQVYNALKEGGYDANRQLRDYLISGDPTYISVASARALIAGISREELISALLGSYFTA